MIYLIISNFNTGKNLITLLNDPSNKITITEGEIIKEVLSKIKFRPGLNLNIKNNIGKTALSESIENNIVYANILLDEMLKRNEKDKEEILNNALTLLMENSQKINHDFINFTIQKGANVNFKHNGKTLLMYAIETKLLNNSVKFLLSEKNIKVNELDNRGKTALSYAAKYGNEEILEILINRNDIMLKQNLDLLFDAILFSYDNGMKAKNNIILIAQKLEINNSEIETIKTDLSSIHNRRGLAVRRDRAFKALNNLFEDYRLKFLS